MRLRLALVRAEKLFKINGATPSSDLTFALALPAQPKERGASSDFTVVKVFYATDRKAEGDPNSIQYTGLKADNGALTYGSCDVSIPETHTVADLERPSIWRLEFHPDPEKHIVLQKVAAESKDRLLNDIASMVAASPEKRPLSSFTATT
jgi:esterase/lipase superfamily enzyme